jgi:hypothetical protein
MQTAFKILTMTPEKKTPTMLLMGAKDDKRDPSQRVGAQDHGGNVRWAGVRQLTEEFQDLVSF